MESATGAVQHDRGDTNESPGDSSNSTEPVWQPTFPKEIYNGDDDHFENIEMATLYEDQPAANPPKTILNPKACLLALPKELRDRIYAFAMPLGTMHIHYEEDRLMGTTLKRGRGLLNRMCRPFHGHRGNSDDRTKDDRVSRVWSIEAGRGDDEWPYWYWDNYVHRHSNCYDRSQDIHANSYLRQCWPTQRWPFALLFTCHQIHGELARELYKNCAFSFMDSRSLRTFTTMVAPKHLQIIQELRLCYDFGSIAPEAAQYNSSFPIHLCESLEGVRKLFLFLRCEFQSSVDVRQTSRSQWKTSYWLRELLNFGSLPLQEVGVQVLQGMVSEAWFDEHSNIDDGLSNDELVGWSRSIAQQMLAPWSYEPTLEFLEKHQKEEEDYHERRWIRKAYPRPESRIPGPTPASTKRNLTSGNSDAYGEPSKRTCYDQKFRSS